MNNIITTIKQFKKLGVEELVVTGAAEGMTDIIILNYTTGLVSIVQIGSNKDLEEEVQAIYSPDTIEWMELKSIE